MFAFAQNFKLTGVGRSMRQVICHGDHPTFLESGIMIPFLAMHTLAAPRGDGLRPELVALLERHEAAPNADLAIAVSEQLQADAAEKAALVSYSVRLPLNQKT